MNRGGSWNNNPRRVRAANRNRNAPDNRNDNLGFRPARPPAMPGITGVMAPASAVRVTMRPLPGRPRTGRPNRVARTAVAGAGSGCEGPRHLVRAMMHYEGIQP